MAVKVVRPRPSGVAEGPRVARVTATTTPTNIASVSQFQRPSDASQRRLTAIRNLCKRAGLFFKRAISRGHADGLNEGCDPRRRNGNAAG